MTKIRKLDVWKIKDREELMKLPCAFCGERKLTFTPTAGYGSQFSDSDFDCPNCGCSYPVGLFFPEKTLAECKDMMKRRALGYYNQLKQSYQEKVDGATKLKKRIEIYESHFNPSKRDDLGR